MTTKELIKKIDGNTRGEIIEQAYNFGFEDGYKYGYDKACEQFEFEYYHGYTLVQAYESGKEDAMNELKVKIDNKPNPPMPKDYGELKIINHPKHILVNGALYEKIDDYVLTIANGYGDA